VDELADKKELLVSGVKPLVSEPVLQVSASVVLVQQRLIHIIPYAKVKKSLAQVIIAMASHDYLSLEGGESLVEFIVRHCAVSDADIAKANAAAAKERAGTEKRSVCQYETFISSSKQGRSHHLTKSLLESSAVWQTTF